MLSGKKILSAVLSAALLLPAASALAEDDAFAAEIERRYTAPSIDNRSEVRWWMAEAGHTDETIRAEIQAMYDGGFRGVELCAQGEDEISETDYGYGSAQWDHDLKLAMNTALDLGMTVSLTSGTNWATANVPGLDPHSQGASQIVVDIVEYIKAGASRSGAIPMQKKVGSKVYPIEPTAKLIGVFAVPQTSGNKAKPIVTDGTGIIELTDKLVWEADGTITLDWTPENAESKYRLFYYWQQGAMQESHPAAETAYCINYFDEAGIEALKEYWLAHILDDEALNAKIQAGDVQLFMDSLEISTEYGCAFWCDDMAEEFLARKGYDIRPYLYLTIGLPDLFYWDAVDYGSYDLADKTMREKVLNDLFDVQTQLYRERMLEPLRAWLHEYGIKTRAQISYGQRLEISEPIMSVDYPEAEILNQNNQVDMYRLWTGGAKLQNKVLSSETGAYGGYAYTEQDHLMEAYNLFAAGFNRIVWHIWSAQYGPGTDNRWPHYTASGAVYASFYAFGPHEPSSVDYPSFNDHLGRICQLLREGVSRTDVGMIYMNYQQPMPTSGNHGGENWLLDHTTGFFPSTTLQDNGYTYDYFSPDFLTADGVSYAAETGTLEQAGYQAIVLWQEQLALDGAKALLDLAKQGMKVVVVDGAAVQTPYNDGGEAALADVMAEMKALPNVYSAKDADDAARVLQSAGVKPYAGFAEPNRQLLTQTRRDGDTEYLYVYNYCDGSYVSVWSQGEKQDTHGDTITTEMVVDGTWIPYQLDAWTGETKRLGVYRHENGSTIFPLTLDYGDVALFVFRACEADSELHAVETNAADVCSDGSSLSAKVTASGEYQAQLSSGETRQFAAQVPDAFEITDWDVTVMKHTASEQVNERTETLFGQTITETQVATDITPVTLHLDALKTWNEIPELGERTVGQATYKAVFQWDGTADGAYIDFGPMSESMQVFINGEKTGDLSMTKAVMDITPWLKNGENTIALLYSSSLANAGGGAGGGDWYGYRYGLQAYGPAQAVVHPYCLIPLD